SKAADDCLPRNNESLISITRYSMYVGCQVMAEEYAPMRCPCPAFRLKTWVTHTQPYAKRGPGRGRERGLHLPLSLSEGWNVGRERGGGVAGVAKPRWFRSPCPRGVVAVCPAPTSERDDPLCGVLWLLEVI